MGFLHPPDHFPLEITRGRSLFFSGSFKGASMSHRTSIDRSSDHFGRRHFVVAQNAHGYWVAREDRGLIEGVFVNQRDAIRFALFETGNRSVAVVAGGQTTAVALGRQR